MSDVSRALQMLDIIQGHPGYEVSCYLCNVPLTDVFGVSLGWIDGISTDSNGARHQVCPEWGGR